MSLYNFFVGGGFWMWPILATQIIAVAIIIERAVSLYMTKTASQSRLADLLESDIKSGRIEKALDRAQGLGNANPISLVARAGAQVALDQGGREEIQSKMDEVLIAENNKLDKRIGFLSMLANVATLLGLLGTIIGLIQAFAATANANALEKSLKLTEGISVAMNTTAYGLIVAIPTLVAFAILQNRANELANDLNSASVKVFNWLSFNYESIPARTVKKRG